MDNDKYNEETTLQKRSNNYHTIQVPVNQASSGAVYDRTSRISVSKTITEIQYYISCKIRVKFEILHAIEWLFDKTEFLVTFVVCRKQEDVVFPKNIF